MGTVEAEGARLDFGQIDTAVHAGEVLAEEPIPLLLRIGHIGDDEYTIA